MRQGVLIEDPVEQRYDLRGGTQAMQGLVRPEAAKHGHITRLRVLAGGGGIGDAGGDGRVRGEPSALRRLGQKPGTYIKDRLSWQQVRRNR